MDFNLTKLEDGEIFNLTKTYGLENIRVELTWDKADLDSQAWLLNADGLIVNRAGFLYYNAENRTEPFDRLKFGTKKNYLESTMPVSSDGAVVGPNDDTNGGKEVIKIDLVHISSQVSEIVISATVYHPSKEFPDVNAFGDVYSARITVIDEDTDKALCYYDLGKDYPDEDAMVVGSFINDDGEWEFQAGGKAYPGGLQTLVDIYTK